jgi:putative ABC transport system substrate-binding protein
MSRQNLAIEWRFADGEYERLPGMAAELVKLKADVILALGPPGAIAAQKATTTIPIVFVVSTDPVAAGLVKSLARPGGNITGLSNLAGDLSPKHLEMLLAVTPKVSRVGVLVNPANSAHAAMLKNVRPRRRKSA